MAKYTYKKSDELTVVWHGRDKYVLCECSQEKLEFLFEKGYACVQKEEEPKKEVNKSSKKEEKEEE